MKLVICFDELKSVEYFWSCIILHFVPHALHILILAIFMHIRVDHAELKPKI
jgi:hypothetical protein